MQLRFLQRAALAMTLGVSLGDVAGCATLPRAAGS